MEIYYKDECYKVVGAAMHVYNVLGSGFLESVYQEALEIEFQRRNIPYEREKQLSINYEGIQLQQKYRADFVCYSKIVVELKAVSALDDNHRAQVHHYLKATQYKLGVLLNFGCADGLDFERIVRSKNGSR
jgi:GxxExxY protein